MAIDAEQSIIADAIRACHPGLQHFYFRKVGGGSINLAYQVTSDQYSFFCKINSASKFPQLFATEARGLEKLKAAGMRTPEPISCIEYSGYQVLLMEWIEEGRRTNVFWQQFGKALARLHQVHNEFFGLDHDNYMGSVAQSNQRSDNWYRFFQHQRLEPLVRLCSNRKLLSVGDCQSFDRLYNRLPEIFGAVTKPSLLHGDLWSGNFLCDTSGEAVLIDPAAYYGHPAIDLGMTQLFGGFAPGFYDAYRSNATLPGNDQCEVANLYPLLIHLYLFGESYRSQIRQILHRY